MGIENNRKEDIAVVGAGSWGTALANLLAQIGHRVKIWAYEKEVAQAINQNRENHIYLPGINLHDELQASLNLTEVLKNSKIILVVIPSKFFRSVVQDPAFSMAKDSIIVTATKGIETKTHLRMSEVLMEEIEASIIDRLAVLSGPSFAKDVAKMMPTAVTIAAKKENIAKYLQDIFFCDYFRVYTSDDIIGVEFGGAIKNVIAIAAGISDGLGLGDNTRAALITRGLAEMSRLGCALGAKRETFFGLAGLGDLVLTCTGDLSRNRQVGLRIGRGEKLNDILSGMKMIAEGVENTEALYTLSQKVKIELPITHQVYEILYSDKPPLTAVKELMSRTPKIEYI